MIKSRSKERRLKIMRRTRSKRRKKLKGGGDIVKANFG